MELSTQRIFRLLVGAVTLGFIVWGLWSIIEILNRGPDANRFRVYVLFKDVQGLQTGSRVVHRGMTLGGVASLELDTQAGRVRALVTLDREAQDLVRTTSQFWVVRPRFTDIQAGPSGLDTLIKESYLRLRVRAGERLRDGEELLGLERPPEDLAQEDLDDAMIGDLLATVKLPHAHGLNAGSPVMFRGQACGEVRHVRLSAEGKGVLVRFRVQRAFRPLVRESSRFWVARPILEGSIFTGITVSSLESLLQGALVFDSRAGMSQPMQDDAVVTGLAAPPTDFDAWDGKEVRSEPAVATPSERGMRTHLLSPWVQVRYRAIEKDTFADDDVQASGEGVLFRNGKGELCALTARSACDGSFTVPDEILGKPRIANERIRVILSDSRVWPANRIWVDPQDGDLVILRLQTPVGATPAPLPEWQTYLDFSRSLSGDPAPDREPPFVVREDGRAYGIIGHAKQDPSKRVGASFASVPESMRPPVR